MMRIFDVLMIGPDPHSQGGMATVIDNILNCSELAEKTKVAIWPSYTDGPIAKRAFFSTFQELKFRLLKHNYDIYHIHTASGTSFWRKRRYINALGNNSRRVVLHVHGGGFIDFWNRCSIRQKKKICSTFNRVGKVIVLSSQWANRFEELGICSEDKIEILPNAVVVPESNKTDYSSNNVLFMGRLDENKSPDVLIRAVPKVVALHPDARFTFAGDGDSSSYEMLAKKLGVSDVCSFPGWISGQDWEDLLCANCIYCLPSQREALPMGLLEAMSYGLVGVATEQGGIPSIINDRVNGRLMKIGDYSGLADILNELMDCRETKAALGESGRFCVQNSFGMSTYAKNLSRIYGELSY